MPKPPVRHPGKARIQPFIPGDIRDRLAAHCATSGRSESTVVAEALKRFLDPLPNAAEVSDQLAQLDATVRELIRSLRHPSRPTPMRSATSSTTSKE
jgi:hypothetical protein